MCALFVLCNVFCNFQRAESSVRVVGGRKGALGYNHHFVFILCLTYFLKCPNISFFYILSLGEGFGGGGVEVCPDL